MAETSAGTDLRGRPEVTSVHVQSEIASEYLSGKSQKQLGILLWSLGDISGLEI